MIKQKLISFFRLILPDSFIIKMSGQKYINRAIVHQKIIQFEKIGVTREKRKTKLIVSLTSFPRRIDEVCYAVYSLLNQTIKPDEVVLWLGEDKFPDKKIPVELVKLMENGLTIKYTRDIKSYTKLVPSIKEFPNDIIVTADDDIYYPSNWLEKLYNSYELDTKSIHCHRAHRIVLDSEGRIIPYEKWEKYIADSEPSYLNFLTGVGGVLYPPNSLCKEAVNERQFMKLSPTADDVWFWAMAVKNESKVRVVNDNIKTLIFVNIETELGLNSKETLGKINNFKNQNDVQVMQVLEQYGLKDKLDSEFCKS